MSILSSLLARGHTSAPVCSRTKPSALRWGKAQVLSQSSRPTGNGCSGTLLRLANTGAEDVPLHFIGAANALELDEQGWATIPYGEHRHPGQDGHGAANDARHEGRRVAVIQRFTRESAQRLVNDYHSIWSTIKRAFTGLPLFKGHPDAPRFARQFPDRTPRGVVADMQVGETGLRVKPVVTPEGAADVSAGWSFLSPYWDVMRVGQAADGSIIAEPVKLHSIGLVQRGNIAGISLTNAAEGSAATSETTKKDPTMPQWLIDLLIGRSLLKAGQAAEDTIRTALANFFGSHDAVVSERDTLKATVATLETEKSALANSAETLKTEKAAAETRATTAEAAVTTLRKDLSVALVNAAIADGRVPAAERETKVTALCNAADFTAETAALAALKPALKTRSALGNLAVANADQRSRTEQVQSLVNAALPQHAGDYDAAFAAVKADPKHAALFASMKRSEGVPAK